MNRWVKVGAVVIALIVVVVISLGTGILIGSAGLGVFAGSTSNEGEPEQFRVFWQAWNTVHDNFVDRIIKTSFVCEFPLEMMNICILRVGR